LLRGVDCDSFSGLDLAHSAVYFLDNPADRLQC